MDDSQDRPQDGDHRKDQADVSFTSRPDTNGMGAPLDDHELSPEAELHALITAFPDVGFILDGDGRYVEVLSSPASESLLYDEPSEMLGSHIGNVFDPEMADRILSNIDRAVGTGELQRFEYSLDVGDGERHFEARIAPVEERCGSDLVVYVARDVTERVRRQRALARQRDYMQSMLDSLDDLFYALDREGNLVDWNRAVESVSGYGPGELTECALVEIFGENAGRRLEAFVAEVFEHGSARRVTEVQTKSGVAIPYEFVASLFEDSAGEDLVVGIGRDVTERREREQQARVFGRVLRHNMRNKMTVVDGTADYIERHADEATAQSGGAERIRSAARDLLRLTEKAHDATDILLDENRIARVDVAETVRDVLDDQRGRYPDAEFTYDGPADLAAEAIPAIRIALDELVENAVEHSPIRDRDDPDFAGETAESDEAPPSVAVSVGARDRSVVVAVSDDGPGLPDHEANIITRERSISPVFHASGIGLWLVRWIVTRSRGEVRLAANDDSVDESESRGHTGVDITRLGGTTIVVELTAADDAERSGDGERSEE